MTTNPHEHATSEPPPMDDLDPANQSLADALRRSFRVLKLLMLVLVILYFLSGWFSVRPGDVGLVVRYGRIVGTGSGEQLQDAVLSPGWYVSWPYPIDRWETVSTMEREIPIQFLFELTEQEQAEGIKGYKYGLLSPLKDDYLITGDANILHASILVKYRITDPVAYLTNVKPMPDPAAGPRAKPYLRYPEYAMMTDLARDAVIETAARRDELAIRGAKQSEFLLAVAKCLNEKIKVLEQSGRPIGISVDPNTGILAPKASGIEGILPPRQVQEAFENVDKAMTQKVVAITKANSDAQSILVRTAGLGHEALAAEVQKEFDLMLRLSANQTTSSDSKQFSQELAAQRQKVEGLLKESAGDVRSIIKKAEIHRDQTIKEAAGDYQQFKVVLPQFERNPDIFVSQLLAETLAMALSNEKVGKMFVPETARGYWLQIPRSPIELPNAAKAKEEKPGVITIEGPTPRKVQ